MKLGKIAAIDFTFVNDRSDSKVASKTSAHPLSAPGIFRVTSQRVSLMTLSEVFDLCEDIGPLSVLEKPIRCHDRRNYRISGDSRGSFLRFKTNKKSSRPNTAVEAIMSASVLESTKDLSITKEISSQHTILKSNRLIQAREELFLMKKRSSVYSPAKKEIESVHSMRFTYYRYKPPLDCFELNRRSKTHAPMNDRLGWASRDLKQRQLRAGNRSGRGRRRGQATKNLRFDAQAILQLETIPEAVGSWIFFKDPRDPRQHRTKLDYVITRY